MSGKKDVPHRRFSKDEKLKIVKEHLEEHSIRGKKPPVQKARRGKRAV